MSIARAARDRSHAWNALTIYRISKTSGRTRPEVNRLSAACGPIESEVLLAWPQRGRSVVMRRVAMVSAGMTPFAEHFDLGIKDLIPRAYAEATANVDKGIHESDIQGVVR